MYVPRPVLVTRCQDDHSLGSLRGQLFSENTVSRRRFTAALRLADINTRPSVRINSDCWLESLGLNVYWMIIIAAVTRV